MSCPVGQYFAFVFLLISIGIPFGSAVNGPTVPIAESNFPYLVRVERPGTSNTAGFFVSKRFVVTGGDVGGSTAAVVVSGGTTYTVVSRQSVNSGDMHVLKLCISPVYNGPYYDFDSAVHTGFTTNQTGKIVFYGQNGTLFAQDTEILNKCDYEMLSTGGSTAYYNVRDVCIKYQQSSCTDIKSTTGAGFTSYPVLVVNGMVEATSKALYCSGVYTLPSVYRKIMAFKGQILTSSGIVVANPGV